MTKKLIMALVMVLMLMTSVPIARADGMPSVSDKDGAVRMMALEISDTHTDNEINVSRDLITQQINSIVYYDKSTYATSDVQYVYRTVAVTVQVVNQDTGQPYFGTIDIRDLQKDFRDQMMAAGKANIVNLSQQQTSALSLSREAIVNAIVKDGKTNDDEKYREEVEITLDSSVQIIIGAKVPSPNTRPSRYTLK
jgi:hypothetical protein